MSLTVRHGRRTQAESWTPALNLPFTITCRVGAVGPALGLDLPSLVSAQFAGEESGEGSVVRYPPGAHTRHMSLLDQALGIQNSGIPAQVTWSHFQCL